MIKFVTGLPGAGKSLRGVQLILAEREKGRAVYVYGLDGLDASVGHVALDDPNKWQDLPDGSFIVLDEAQKVWPSRRTGEPPEPIRALSEHRHRGFDFLILTQHPTMMDSYVRKLGGEHEHVIRQFGKQGAKLVTWSEVYDDPQSLSTRQRGTETYWLYPKKNYELYKSATLHTVKSRIPLRLKIIPVLVLVAAALAYVGYRSVSNIASVDPSAVAGTATPDGLPGAGAGGMHSGGPKYRTPQAYAAAFTPMIPGQPWTAPAFADRDPVSKPELYCIATEALKCICHTEQGTRYAIETRQCLMIAVNGSYNPFRAPIGQGENRTGAPSSEKSANDRRSEERPAIVARVTPRDPPQSFPGGVVKADAVDRNGQP